MSTERPDRKDSLFNKGVERSADGKIDQIKGKVKDAAGGLTGDRGLQAEGKMDHLKGKAKDAMGKAERAVSDMMDRDHDKRR